MIVNKHKNVFEYDGFFKCLNCQQSWGALPGNPEEPKKCILTVELGLKACVADAIAAWNDAPEIKSIR